MLKRNNSGGAERDIRLDSIKLIHGVRRSYTHHTSLCVIDACGLILHC